jgi:hypothetical protein
MGECFPEDVGSKFNETPVNFYQNTLQSTPQDILDTHVTFSMSVLKHIYQLYKWNYCLVESDARE